MEDLAAREPHKATSIPRVGRSRGGGWGAIWSPRSAPWAPGPLACLCLTESWYLKDAAASWCLLHPQ